MLLIDDGGCGGGDGDGDIQFIRTCSEDKRTKQHKDAPCSQQVGAVYLNVSSLYFDAYVTHKTAIR